MSKYLSIPASLWRNPKYWDLSNAELAALVKLAAWCASNNTKKQLHPRAFKETGVHPRVRNKLIAIGFIKVDESDNRMTIHIGGGGIG